MIKSINRLVDKASEFLAPRKGLLPSLGLLFIVSNFISQLFITGWFSESNILLHVGLVIAIFGLMLAWAL